MKKRPKSQPNISCLVVLIKELQDGATARELEEVSGLAKSTVKRWIKALRLKNATYIEAWEKDCCGRNVVPVHRLGDSKDAKKPRKATPAERAKANRERKQLKRIEAALMGKAI